MSSSKAKQILVLAIVFVFSQVLNRKQTEKVMRKTGLKMPKKTRYKIRDGFYFDFFAPGGTME